MPFYIWNHSSRWSHPFSFRPFRPAWLQQILTYFNLFMLLVMHEFSRNHWALSLKVCFINSVNQINTVNIKNCVLIWAKIHKIVGRGYEKLSKIKIYNKSAKKFFLSPVLMWQSLVQIVNVNVNTYFLEFAAHEAYSDRLGCVNFFFVKFKIN